MSKPLFILRGRNRLTGDREVVSEPLPRDKILQLKLEYTNMRGTKKPYTHVKIEPYPPPRTADTAIQQRFKHQ